MNKNIIEVLKKITAKGFEAYVVGGYPRDLYLKKHNSDIDICTNAKYENLSQIFEDIEENSYLSYKIKYKDKLYEITTYRKERRYLKNRFPVVKYTNSLKKDIKRRDFTINTLCLNEKGKILDILNAKKDIDNKIIKLVGPKKKIKDDSLRILRAIRFATILNFTIDKKLEKAIIKYKDNLNNLSFERKKQELEKILTSENCRYGIDLIKKYELEQYLKVDLTNYQRVEETNGIWAQIIIDESYNFTKNDKKQITLIKKLLKKTYNPYNIYKYGTDIMKIVCTIKQEEIDIDKEYKKIPIKDRDDIKINYIDICKNILANNDNITTIYEDLEKKIISKKIKNQKRELIKYIKQKYQK